MPTPIPTVQHPTLKKLINETYTDGVESILDARLEDDGTIIAVASDEDRIVAFKYTDDLVSVRVLNPEVIEGEEEPKADSVLRVDKSCKKGIPCGRSCISKKKVCRKKLTGAGKKAAQKAAESGGTGSYQELVKNGESDPIKEKIDQINQRYEKEVKPIQEEFLQVEIQIEDLLQNRDRDDFNEVFDKLAARESALEKQEREALTFRDLQIEQEMFDLRDRLMRETPRMSVKVDPSLSKRTSGIAVKQWRSWTDEVNQLTGGQTSSLKQLIYKADRAYATKSGFINVGASFSEISAKSSLFHEFGHHLEFSNPQLKDAAKDWIESRRSGPNRPLSQLVPGVGYDPSEVAVPDKFIAPYVGRDYGNRATEVFSMGVEHFATPRGMQQLYVKDPEHFYLVLGAIK